jgi:hypothetical protein
VLRQVDSWFEHYNRVHPHKALGYRSPREFRNQIVEMATENAVGAVRQRHEGTTATEAIGSRQQQRTRWRAAPTLRRAQPWTTPNNYSLSGDSGATTFLFKRKLRWLDAAAASVLSLLRHPGGAPTMFS